MPDDLTATLTATLAAIRQRYANTRAPITGNSVTVLFASASDVPRLLAAVEAVLGLADGWDVPATYLNDDMSDPNAPARECADDLRQAITAALAGTGGSDE